MLQDDETRGIIVAEGKRTQLEKFVGWLEAFAVPIGSRRPTFQGPALQVTTERQKWEAFSGDIAKGFFVSHDVPRLADGSGGQGEGQLEARSMAGTDESV